MDDGNCGLHSKVIVKLTSIYLREYKVALGVRDGRERKELVIW